MVYCIVCGANFCKQYNFVMNIPSNENSLYSVMPCLIFFFLMLTKRGRERKNIEHIMNHIRTLQVKITSTFKEREENYFAMKICN